MTTTETVATLPDLLEPGLSVVFCGINPGMLAASTGRHFAGRGNRFWRVLYLAGLTPELLGPEQDRTLLRYGCGLTTVVTRATANAAALSRAEIEAAASDFERKIASYAPRNVAFLGKMAIATLRGERDIEWGPQAQPFGGARVWVLPNPSGLNRTFSLDALVEAYHALSIEISSQP